MLVASFKVQFDLQQIYWPSRFTDYSKEMFPLKRISVRIQSEIFNALYQKQSTLKTDTLIANNIRNEV